MAVNEKETRMGSAPLGRLMLSMGIPTLIAQLINILYNIVDRIYIGHISGVGPQALIGIGLCVPVITLIAAFSQFAGFGGSPLAAISLGKGDREQAEKIVANAFSLLIIFAAVLMTVFYLIKKPFMYMFGASDDTYPFADAYLSIYLLGTLFVQLSLGMNSFITAQGQTRISMCTVLIGAISNIILDPIFIFLLNMGIRGAAIATVISQFFSAVWTISFLTSERASLKLKFRYMPLDAGIIRRIASLGISPFFMASTESLITVIFNRGMFIYGSDLYVGSITILQSIMSMIFTPISGFGQGVQPIISYNYGAGNIDRVKECTRKIITLALSVSMILSLSVIFFPDGVISLFTNDRELLAICRRAVPIFLAGMTIFGIQSGCQQSFMALGQAKKAFFFALFRKVILLVPLALILPAVTGSVYGLYFAEPISDALSATVCGLTFWRFIRTLGNRNE